MVSEPIEQFLNCFRDYEQKYRIAVEDEEEMNRVTQDILHEIELEERDVRKSERSLENRAYVKRAHTKEKES